MEHFGYFLKAHIQDKYNGPGLLMHTMHVLKNHHRNVRRMQFMMEFENLNHFH